MRQFAALLFAFLTVTLNAQWCGTADDTRPANDPLLVKWASQQAIKKQSAGKNALQVGNIISIPVVFHVMHLGDSLGVNDNVSDSAILNALQYANQDFRNTAGLGADMEIEFCLAQRDPMGRPTTGITRHNVSAINGAGFGYGFNSNINNAVRDLSNWPNRDYINVWIYRIYAGLGAAGLANSFEGSDSARIGAVVRPYSIVQADEVLAHELAHVLGLHHTFKDYVSQTPTSRCPVDTNCAKDGDRICDTPPHRINECDSNICSGSSNYAASIYNFMSYCSPGSRVNKRFTPGQRDYMHFNLNTQRLINGLMYSAKCMPAQNNDLSIGYITGIPANRQTCNESVTVSLLVNNEGPVTVTDFSVVVYNNNIAVDTVPWTGSIPAYDTLRISLGMVAVNGGVNNLRFEIVNPNGSTDPYSYNNSIAAYIESERQANNVLPGTAVWQWALNTRDSSYCKINDMVVDGHGNTYVAGYVKRLFITGGVSFNPGIGAFSAFIGKLNKQGVMQWLKALPDNRDVSEYLAIDVAGDGTIWAGGYYRNNGIRVGGDSLPGGMNGSNGLLVRYDTAGAIIKGKYFTNNYGTNSDNRVMDIAAVSGDRVFVGGRFTSRAYIDSVLVGHPNSKMRFFVACYDLNAGLQFLESDMDTFAANSSWCNALTHDGAGNVIATIINNAVIRNFGPINTGLVKWSAAGSMLWARDLGVNIYKFQNAYTCIDSSGNVYCGAKAASGSYFFNGKQMINRGDNDVCIFKTDPTGNPLWVKTYGGTGSDDIGGVAYNAKNNTVYWGFITSGSGYLNCITATSVNQPNMAIYENDANGDVVWYKHNFGFGQNLSTALHYKNGALYVAGSYGGNLQFDNLSFSAGFASGTLNVFVAKMFTCDTAYNVTGNGTAGCGGGTINLQVANGHAPYNVAWAGGQATGLTVTGLAAGTYALTVTDVNGCADTLTVTVPVATAVFQAGIDSVAHVTCHGGATGYAAVLATGGVAPYSYVWANGDTTNYRGQLPAGSYTVTVTDAATCADTLLLTIQQPALLIGGTDSLHPVTCQGPATGYAALQATGGTPPYTYLWGNGDTVSVNPQLQQGIYEVTITDAAGCADTILFIIMPASPVTAAVDSFAHAGCFGAATGYASIAVAGGTAPYTYLWSNGHTAATNTQLPQGSYIITVTDAANCADTVSVTIQQPAQLVLTIDSIKHVSCYGGANGYIAVSAGGGTPPYQYMWSTGDTGVSLTNIAHGFYDVTAGDAAGCTASVSATIQQPDSISATVNTTTSCANPGTGYAAVQVTGGTSPYTYLWSNGDTVAVNPQLPYGAYSITITDAAGCNSTVSFNLQQSLPLTASVDSVADVRCFGSSTGYVAIGVTGGAPPYNYAWSNGGTGSINPGLPQGNYIITVTDANSCTDTVIATVQQPLLLAASADSVKHVSCFAEADGYISVKVTGGTQPYNYAWDIGGTAGFNTSLTAGLYVVTVTDAASCTDTVAVNLQQPTNLVAVVDSIADVRCYGTATGYVTVQTTGGVSPYTYLWSNGNTLNPNPQVPNGFYEVTVTDATGCTGQVTFNMVQPPQLQSNVSIASTGCIGTNATLSATASGGQAPYGYLWQPFGTGGSTVSQLIDSTIQGLLIVTDAAGCADSSSFTITAQICISVNEVPALPFRVYPNPASDHIIIAGAEPINYAELFDILGQRVNVGFERLQGPGQVKLVLPQLAEGVYTLRVLAQTGQGSTLKVVIKK